MDEEPNDPLILGRPLLATTEALIGVKNLKIDLRLGSKTLTFDFNKLNMKPTINSHFFHTNELEVFAKAPIKETTTEYRVQSTLTNKQQKHGLLEADDEVYKKEENAHTNHIEGKKFLEMEQTICTTQPKGARAEDVDTRQVDQGYDWSRQKVPRIPKQEIKPGERHMLSKTNPRVLPDKHTHQLFGPFVVRKVKFYGPLSPWKRISGRCTNTEQKLDPHQTEQIMRKEANDLLKNTIRFLKE